MGSTYLIIQTAFLGDVVLATSVAEKIHTAGNDNKIDFLVRKGNESIFHQHPYLNDVITWEKNTNKYGNLLNTLRKIRGRKYDVAINLQRFASTGFLASFSNAKKTIGFSKNPFSILFTERKSHDVKNGLHEIARNQKLIASLTDDKAVPPRLYPSDNDFQAVKKFKERKYITLSPSSVWFTKTLPSYKWAELISLFSGRQPDHSIYLLGSRAEFSKAEEIRKSAGSKNITNLSGELSILESAALMKHAEMNYTNDSAPLHLASAMNAPVTAIYCSTSPEYGFWPLADRSKTIEETLNLKCHPCGLHGYRECPLVHFKCAHSINVEDII